MSCTCNRSYRRGTNCAVYGCTNYKHQREPKSFFRMPKNPNLLKIWVAACKSDQLDLFMKTKDPEFFYNKFVVCSDHFQLTCFRNKNLFSQGLIPGSVPTLKVFNVQTPVEEKIPDKTQEVEIEKIWLNEERNKKFETADAVVLDKSTSLACTSSNVSLSLEKENVVVLDESTSLACTSSNVSLSLEEEDAVVSDESTSLACTSNILSLSLEEENIRLKLLIKEYKKKLRYKDILLWKCKKRNQLLQEKLLQKKIVSNPVKIVADQKINLMRINLDDWD